MDKDLRMEMKQVFAPRPPEKPINLKVRLRKDLHKALVKAAQDNHRSLNMEIVHRLYQSF